MNFIEKNLHSLMMFSLALSALFLYGYNQTTDMKEVLIFLAGGFTGFITTVIKNTLLVPSTTTESNAMVKEFLSNGDN